MLKALKNNRNIVILAIFVVIVLQIAAMISATVMYGGVLNINFVLYAYVTALAHCMLWRCENSHKISAIFWSLQTTVLLGFVGIFAPVCFWFLISCKSEKHETNSKKKKKEKRNRNKNKRYARIPLLRIPIPWVTYTLSPEIYKLTKDNFFAEKRLEGDTGAHNFFGKKDPLLLTTVEEYYFSNSLISKITGVSCFSFKSKKIGDKQYVHWHCLPLELVDPLDTLLTELKQPKK